MPSAKTNKKPSKTLKEKINEDRLEAWRKSRAEIAEKSRQERLRLAAAEREARMKQFHDDQKRRVSQAAETRARADAAQKAERLARATAMMPTRADTDAAAVRLQKYRGDAMRRMLAQACLFVFLPTILVAGYLFAVATPLYEARVDLLVVRDMPAAPNNAAGVFGTIRAPGGAADLAKTLILSETVFTALDEQAKFSDLLSDHTIDPITRFDPNRSWRVGRSAQFQRFVKVSVNPANDQAQLSVLAPTPDQAKEFTDIVLKTAQLALTDIEQKIPNAATVVIYPIAPASLSDFAPYPRKFYGTACALIGFAGLFFVGRAIATSVALGIR